MTDQAVVMAIYYPRKNYGMSTQRGCSLRIVFLAVNILITDKTQYLFTDRAGH